MYAPKRFLWLIQAIGVWLFSVLFPGCGDDEGEGAAPRISNLFIGPASAQVLLRGGELGVTVSMDYADQDGDIAFVRMSFRFCGKGSMRHEDIAPMGITGDQAGEIWISAQVPTACRPGTYMYTFSVFDQKGHQSNRLEAPFTLTPLREP